MGATKRIAAAGSSDAFEQRVHGKITAAQYVRSLDQRVSDRRKADKSASKAKKAAK